MMIGVDAMKTPVLETERLTLRRFTRNDVQEVFDCWQSDPDVSRYMMWESSKEIEKAREFIDYELTMIDSDTWYRWCITKKESGTIIGTCLIYFNEEEKCWDISYNLGKKYWGVGYTTEAMKAAMDFAIHSLKVHEFVAAHAIENPASGRVIRKLGFHYEGEIEYICNGGNIHTTGKKYRLRT
ncbi:MAG: GNAT family N-acetyltransferase [bacterium]|nr:GNAT family N-acetyltransferase [bacterium]